jgi:uncharacterized protein YicC (UPF0701 family)
MQNMSDFTPNQYGISKRDIDTGAWASKNPRYFEQIEADSQSRLEGRKQEYIASIVNEINKLNQMRSREGMGDFSSLDKRISELQAYLQKVPSMSAEELFPPMQALSARPGAIRSRAG